MIESPAISTEEFDLFQQLIAHRAGIRLNDSKRALLVGRLSRRVRDLGLGTFRDYYQRVMRDRDERTRMLDLITTNETEFFREPAQFAFVEKNVIPRWLEAAEYGRRERRVRVWSAGCSTGEEPYSVAMLLHSNLPGWEIEILGTDLSTRVIDAAERAIWPAERLANIPLAYRRPYVLNGTGAQEGRITVSDTLRRLVHFRRLNLIDTSFDVLGSFDIVLCRNVLIYFDAELRRAVIDRLVDRCAVGGYFLLGHAEALNGASSRLTLLKPTIWTRTS